MNSASMNSFQDDRDGQEYPCCRIDQTLWMARSYAFDSGKNYRNGRYPWGTAQELCPDGWRLPTRQDFEVLLDRAATLAGLPLWSCDDFEMEWFSYCFDLNECLVEDPQLGFYMDAADYNRDRPDNIRGLWLMEPHQYFMSDSGQNELVLDFRVAGKKDFHHVRYVREQHLES